ncbi:MAG TPA: zinc ribbon domain-containing protein [Methanomassiliicoccales archaeon]|nr:zinc ribbon domain-containing protein [Methanomassiliicoccales archaeon]
MAYCPKCGESLDEGWEYCSSCGHQLPLKCPHCQAELSPGSRFCSKCRNPVSTPDSFETSPPLETYQESKRDDMWILLILGVIFIIVGLIVGICFFVGIIMIVVYVIIEFSRKPTKK